MYVKNCPFMTNNKNMGKRVKNQNHTCTIHRNITNSFIPLGSNIQFSTNRKRTSNNKKNLNVALKSFYKSRIHLFPLMLMQRNEM
jgi:adenine-specific DNA methylase